MTSVCRITFALALALLTAAPAGAQGAGSVRVIVQFKEHVAPESSLSTAGASAQRQRIRSAAARVLAGPAGRRVLKARAFATIPYAAMEVEAGALAQLAADPAIARVQIDRLERPSLAQSTALVQATSTAASGYRGAGWSVALLDTGVDRHHTFLGGRVIYEGCFSTTNASSSASSLCPSGADEQIGPGAAAPCTISSECEHGTHVAGIIAGSGSEFSGVAPSAGILAFQVFTRFDSASVCGWDPVPCVRTFASDQIAALEQVYLLRDTYAIAAVNMSFGGDQYTSAAQCDADNSARKAVIDNLRAAGIATVSASGNEGHADALSAPACISTVISVGATSDGPFPTVASFSNSASWLSLLAPGTPITSSVPGNTFATKGGTSMAAPHVSGAWAVLKEAMPSASVASILSALQATGLPISDANAGRPGALGIVTPLIQVRAALERLLSSPPAQQSTPDIDNDGFADLVWQNRAEGLVAAWMMSGMTLKESTLFSPAGVGDPNWRVATSADVDGDGKLDLVWQEETQGWIVLWRMDGLNLLSSTAFSVERVPDTNWRIVAARDFNGDGRADLVWQHRTDGYIALWYLNGPTVLDSVLFSPGQVPDVDWQIEAAADFNGDGKPDLLWRHRTQGWVTVWLMNGRHLIEGRDLTPNRVADTNWRVAAVIDVNRDGMPDLVWQDLANGWIGVWLMNGTTLLQSTAYTPERVADTNWRIVGPK